MEVNEINAISRIRRVNGDPVEMIWEFEPVEMIWEFEDGKEAVYDFRFGRLSMGKNGKAVETVTTSSIEEVTKSLIRFSEL